MATKAVNLEKQVKCPICLEQYKEPKVLSCLHSYCKSCLQKYVTKSSAKRHKIKCPECCQETEVPDGEVDKLQANFWVNNLISLLTITSSDKVHNLICENCDSDDTAVSRCADCCVFMCEFCVKVHKRLHNLKHHKIVSLEEVKSGSPKALIKSMHCDKHNDDSLKLFCQTCDKPICRDCAMFDHQGHKYVFVADAATKEKESVRKLLDKTKIKAPSLANGVKAVEEMKQRVATKMAVVNRHIDAFRDQQIKALENIVANLKCDTNTIGQAKLEQLQAQREDLMIALASVKNSVEFTERALKDGGNVEVLSMKKQLVTNLSKLKSSTWECEPRQEDTFQLTVHQDISQVVGNIATVDDVAPEKCTISMVGGEEGVIYDTLAGQRREFTVLVVDNRGEKRNSKNIDVLVVCPGETQGDISDIPLTDNINGSCSFAFLPRQQGCYQLRVSVSSDDVPGSPFQWNVVPPAYVSKPEQPNHKGYSQEAQASLYSKTRQKTTSFQQHPGLFSMGVSRVNGARSRELWEVPLKEQTSQKQFRRGIGALQNEQVGPLGNITLERGTLSWKVIARAPGHMTGTSLRFGPPCHRFSIASTGMSSREGRKGRELKRSFIKSWQAGDVFVLFLNMNTRKLIIQNLRTSETDVFEDVEGTKLSPHLYPYDSDMFSLDV